MRSYLVRALCVIALSGIAAGGTVGCKASLKVGGAEKPPPPPPPPPKAEPKPEPEPARRAVKVKDLKLKQVGEKIQIPEPIFFETGTATIKTESEAVLNLVVEYMKANPKITKLRIEGHTDTDGADASNQTLSENRSFAVALYLQGKGVDCKRLIPVGFGESKLLVTPEKTADDKAQNRRVDFLNAEREGKAIGGAPIDGGGKVAGDNCK